MNDVSINWPTIVGLIGTLLILLAFFLLQTRRLHGNGVVYQLLNAIGAAAIIVSLFYAFNLASMLLEIAWLLISLYGIAIGVRHRRTTRNDALSPWGSESSRPRKGPH
ncbi:MAG: CBU_0592 family membrane protein [Rhodanobacteraceae bacterium]